jgi:hypothetical protein
MKKEKKSLPKVAILMKSEVENINADYTAGCERVFLQDTRFLLSQKLLSHSYTSCQIKGAATDLEKVTIRLFYPHRIVNFLDKCSRKSDSKLLTKLLFFFTIYSYSL